MTCILTPHMLLPFISHTIAGRLTESKGFLKSMKTIGTGFYRVRQSSMTQQGVAICSTCEEERVKDRLKSVAEYRVQQLRKGALKSDPSLIVEVGPSDLRWTILHANVTRIDVRRCLELYESSSRNPD